MYVCVCIYLSLSLSLSTYIYMYIYICVGVCMCIETINKYLYGRTTPPLLICASTAHSHRRPISLAGVYPHPPLTVFL